MTLLITILTGARPGLLERTLRSVESCAPVLVEAARVVALVNGTDERSSAILRERAWVNTIHERPERLGIGLAISQLMDLAELDKSDLLLHLEDDWECSGRGWYESAAEILRRDKHVGQVRLRRHAPTSRVGHAVSRYHMVTHKPITWEPRAHGRYLVARAHYTFNPTLVRTEVAQHVFPCDSEVHAAQKFGRTRFLAAQVIPGAFRHIGGADSLREKVGGA